MTTIGGMFFSFHLFHYFSSFFLSHGIHPIVISNSLHTAAIKAVELYPATGVPVELSDYDFLVKSASTSLNIEV